MASRPARRLTSFAAIDRAIIACTLCPRLREHCENIARVKKRSHIDETYWGKPVPAYGDPRARLLIIGLAPAAHGANRTGRMFTGDSSGSWLYEALHRFGFSNQPDSTGRDDGLVLRDCYVTAAGRCAPPLNKPTTQELENCRPFLEAEIGLLRRVRVTVVLGRIGYERWLRASGWWDKLAPRDRPPFAHGAESKLPDGMTMIASFHPSQQNTNTGKLTRAMWFAIFRRAKKLLESS